MAEKNMRSVEELEREIDALKQQMQVAGVTVPKTVAGTFKHEGKKYAFKTGIIKLRANSASIGLTPEEAEGLYDEKGLLICEKALKNSKVMIHLIERGANVLDELKAEEKPKGAKTEDKKTN